MTDKLSIPECVDVIGEVLFLVEERGIELNPLDIECAIACLEIIKEHCNRVDAVATQSITPPRYPWKA